MKIDFDVAFCLIVIAVVLTQCHVRDDEKSPTMWDALITKTMGQECAK